MALSSFPASAFLLKMPGDHDSVRVSLTTAENVAEALAFAMRIDRVEGLAAV